MLNEGFVFDALGETSTRAKLVNLTSSTFAVSLKLRAAKMLPVIPIESWPFDGWFDVLIEAVTDDPVELIVKF